MVWGYLPRPGNASMTPCWWLVPGLILGAGIWAAMIAAII